MDLKFENINLNPNLFEKKYVYDVYSNIANHFDKTRYHTWPKIRDFVNNLDTLSAIYDIGCGNGRNMNIRKDCKFIGYDQNENLIQEAQKKNLNCQIGDNLNLPVNDNQADAILSIAVIHHFCTRERRLLALSELFRILKVNGKILIYVWSHEQQKFEKDSKDTFLKWTNQSDDNIFYRYYHLFEKDELEKLIIHNFPNISIVESGNQCHNWYVIATKNF